GGAGASAFLDKPVSQSRLWDTLIGIITPQQAKPRLMPGRSEDHATLAGVRVLLVEDNDINQQIARELMESMGVTVTLADNGQQALDLLLSAPDPLPWSLVLMDLQMPVMDGHQATLLLRQQARFANLPIIALTAHASAEEGARCLREGMNAHLTKPIEPAALRRSIAYWSKAAAGGAELRINGIDVDKGLLQCGGNRNLYESLLQRFVASLVNTPREIRQALEAGDMPLAERSAHTLKGVAANLGAGVCSRLSSELERSVTRQEPPAVLHARLTALEQHLAELNLAISRALPTSAPAQPDPAAAVDREQLQRLCRQLAVLLRSSNVQARLLLQEHAALLHGGLGPHFASLQRRVQDFEFSQALTELYDAASAVQLDLP
ncbi:MAG: response regulator, partial [Comamonadaceae bacterium]